MTEVFTGSFTQQEPICEEGIAAAVEVMRHGRLHRYNTASGEISHTALLEEEFAAFTGAKYALAVASGGYAIGAALRAAGVQHGDPVLTNAFTLAPVPGAIASVGGIPDLVEVTEDLVIDLDHLETKAATGQSKYLLLSHMRGHICDMDRLMAICNAHGIIVIEDCAHTMGATFKGIQSGRHGLIGCYSTQTYKHMNSGEGGFLVTDDAETMARAIILSGSYMLYERHRAAPPSEIFERVKYVTPNISGRMDNLRAAILRPQIATLQDRIDGWNARYARVEEGLSNCPGLRTIRHHAEAVQVGSSIQFLLPEWPAEKITDLLLRCAKRGVELKWFGKAEPIAFTSRYDSWQYFNCEKLPRTDRILAGLIDMRLPLTFSLADCDLISRIIRDEVSILYQAK
ncbi:DegT/DnrJ/EryC1/StrS family aminotransferase [Donghicola eburneus]|uniref:Aminotransferase, DegT/DnrJ/EryC1/StrS family protein n=1 Tax=Donghicola eburneus TaxID=393278 RepID=A0A1M4MXE5_9RHOB|nr:aminotransferase class I/II-fold pyridoxal phosphate-dependent enzyme [Donghicola eburneus]SCM67241.1 aminotransferase, DegT/DnrJ/EryC1/StrS family protein [Donghicola eburneus]SFQ69829.1 dTDP-4-amino-4,6-dideoxygalactose transaminase [Donghicola eburneus]